MNQANILGAQYSVLSTINKVEGFDPSALAVEDGILVSYYHSDGSDACLHASKIVKIRYDEFDQ